ncbi:alpha-1,2-mannosyltransferase [Streptacidiphilus sp. MAP12-16]|uniref:glycosyltransferase 87 family protein n=1 Tax=Streptacidiphilus sp. MAP12-16 TaxID=3156300 RepID=UPI0035194C57
MTSLDWDTRKAGDEQDGRATGSRVGSAAAAVRRALREAPRRETLIAFWVGLGSLLTYAVVRHLVGVTMVDMVVYRAEGAAVAHGHDLYNLRVTEWNLPATYPPFAAMLFTPTAWLPVGLLRILVTSGNLVLLGAFAYLSAELVGWPRRTMRPALVFLAVGLGVWLEPVFTTLRYGQINLLIGVLVLYDLTRPDHRRSKGVALGLAAAIKLTPGLFAVYLLLSGRARAAVTAGLTCLVTMILGALVLPGASLSFWTKYVFDTSRVGKEFIVDNQSLRGLVERALRTPDGGTVALLVTAVVGIAGLAIAIGIHRNAEGFPRARAWSVLSCAVTALLVSPISWTHHWIWCVPMLILLAAEAAQERARVRAGTTQRRPWRNTLIATGVAFCSFSMWLVPHHGLTNLRIPYYLQPFAAIYPLIGLAFLALAGERLRRHLRRHPHRGSLPGSAAADPAARPSRPVPGQARPRRTSHDTLAG